MIQLKVRNVLMIMKLSNILLILIDMELYGACVKPNDDVVARVTWKYKDRYQFQLTGNDLLCLRQAWEVNDTRSCWLNDKVTASNYIFIKML